MSTIFAKIFGIYFLVIGIAFLINPERFKGIYKQVAKDENFLLLGSMFALILGATVIALHNLWMLEWPLVITILGWWSLFKGATLMIYPESIQFFSFIKNRSLTFYRSISVVYILLGLFLIYKGY